ncbi:glycerophosphodiester phosphodiesterase [Halobacillus sp. Marseille-Q1614]|uniref:glycerophosphodiester phosphodiesterase n=1 Tax=Halobacillus sp. Marseille-Q1614 TaxID=2709134 RepID=UPI00156D4185|nr:glycerophosphodiester phosphodiesterase [Halobacillus sp. Marseille-Q1614]
MNRYIFIFLVGLMFFGVAAAPLSTAHADEVKNKDRKQTLNIAHRGASGYAPENTIAAFDKAVEMKADMFEVDVQMSKDGELVLIHDTTLDRTTDGSGNVGDFTYEELQKLDAGSWFGEEFAGEKIPTLGEVLDKYRGKIGILIELKSPALYPGIEEKVAEELKARNLDKPENDKIIVQSFNHESVQKVHELLPSMPLGVLLGNTEVTDEQLSEFASYAEYFNPNKAMITKEFVDRLHSFDLQTQPYTVRDQASADYLLKAGVDGIITDFPDYVDPR